MHKLSEHAYITLYRENSWFPKREKKPWYAKAWVPGRQKQKLDQRNYIFFKLLFSVVIFSDEIHMAKFVVDWNCSKRLSIIVQWNSNNHDFFIFFFWCCCCFFSPNQLIETRFSSRGYSSDIPSSYFIRLSKVWIMLHKGSVGRVQWNVECSFIFSGVFLAVFVALHKICVFIIIYALNTAYFLWGGKTRSVRMSILNMSYYGFLTWWISSIVHLVSK